VSLSTWFGKQFAEPTAIYHGTGWAMLVIEVAQSWLHGHVVDPGVVYVAFGLIAGGITQDRLNTPPIKP